ncbi:MAG TPA: glycosyltransferase family 2 protein [Rhodocyclaceae bacterium]|nr:glycosyltransferase family 2 protein [Rhodocyclaceae bacterium]
MARPTLSVIVIVRNEAALIAQCLDSVTWADEIVVVDSGSTDGTPEICRRYTDKVFVTPDWPGFGPQKNRALDLATSDWVLALDADETISIPLATEIAATIALTPHDVYAVKRLSSFLGRPIRHGDWWPDEVPRLFRRGCARFSDDPVHERLVFEGRPARLRALMMHDSIRSLDQMCAKMNHYTSAGAERLARAGKRGGLGKAIRHGLWAFLRAYLLKRGFLDGREGFILAVSAAESAYYRYLKRLYLP